jgi:hypothetical protein
VNDVAINTQWTTSLLDEAAAIVEAEWIRLQQDEALWERELADLAADLPAPRPGPPRVGVTTTAMARDADMGYPAVSSVRSGCSAERHCRTREVMPPPMITSRQRLSCCPHTIQMSRHRGRLQRPESVCARTATRGGISKWSVHHVVATPGQAAARPAPVGRPGVLTTSISDSPGGAASMS